MLVTPACLDLGKAVRSPTGQAADGGWPLRALGRLGVLHALCSEQPQGYGATAMRRATGPSGAADVIGAETGCERSLPRFLRSLRVPSTRVPVNRQHRRSASDRWPWPTTDGRKTETDRQTDRQPRRLRPPPRRRTTPQAAVLPPLSDADGRPLCRRRVTTREEREWWRWCDGGGYRSYTPHWGAP